MATPIELSYRPWPHQRRAHGCLKRFNCIIWHRRAGKTEFALNELILNAAKDRRRMPSYAYVAPKRNQGKTVAWDRLKTFARQIPGTTFNETELFCLLRNGAKIRIFGADDPDALRGIHLDGVILDEVADMKPRVWTEIIRPALSDHDRLGWAIFIGTPRGHDFLYKIFTQARQSPDDWFADLQRASETGVIAPDELKAARETMSPAQFAQEYECDFGASSSDSILTFEEVRAAIGLEVEEECYSEAARVLGVDVARFGEDSSCIIGRQGIWSGKPKLFRQLSTMELADQVARSIDMWGADACFIDAGGAGGGVIDRLHQLGYDMVIGVSFGAKPADAGAYRNKRVEMWARMATWIREGGSLDEDFPLDEIFAPKVDYRDAAGRMELESKASMRDRGVASPDVADALALTFASPVSPRFSDRGNGRVERNDTFAWMQEGWSPCA
ncbi:MAG: terminase family protein [Akkermansia sp.]|nr:terminase family protein [Akkermansia sp.]